MPVGGAENGVRVTGVTVTEVIAAETGLAGRLVDAGVATTASNVEAASCSSSPRGLNWPSSQWKQDSVQERW